jgi:Uma2 family endonuclease
MEFPYRPVAEFEFRAADVAVVSQQRWDSIDPNDNLRGSPELVVEVKSPSNTRRNLQELVTLCLGTGSLECWIVDPDQQTVTVVRSEGSPIVHRAGGRIPLASFGGGELPVDDIFA